MTKARTLLLALAALLALLGPTPGAAAAPPHRRVLHVSLYPYIPDAPAAALALTEGFERDHPDVRVEITFNPNYYSLDPKDGGVLYEDADVHEIDVVFLKDFVDRGRLAPLPAGFVASLEPSAPLAAGAATVNGQRYGAPQWMCADFLFYRADETPLPPNGRLADLEASLAHDGLLIDLSRPALGELYMSALVARGGAPADLPAPGGAPDPDIAARIARLLALEPAGFGRNPAYNARGSFYARQFARRSGGAFVGYSEMLHEVFEETAVSCRVEERCVTPGEVRVAAPPLADGRTRPDVWVDMFAIDRKARGRTVTDAEAFIRYAVSLPAYRALLAPPPGGIPRYLLPAAEAAFGDPDILRAAPLYPQLKAIVDQGAVLTAAGLSDRLDAVADRLDAALPKDH